MALSYAAGAQTNIDIVLVTNRPIDKVEVYNLEQNETDASHYTDTVHFRFNKRQIDAYNIDYVEGEKRYHAQVWLNPGNVSVSAHLDHEVLVIDTVVGAPMYYAAQAFDKTYAALCKTNDSAVINPFLLQAYEENIGSAFSYTIGLDYLLRNQNNRAALLRLKTLVDRQGDSLTWSLMHPMFVDALHKRLDLKKISVGDFPFVDRNGKAAKLSLSGADTYILDFWFLACPPCVREHRSIKPLLDKLAADHIQVIGITTDQSDKMDTWRAYLEENDYTWANYMQGHDGTLSNYLALHIFPTYMVLDGSGNLLGAYNAWEEALQEAESAKPAEPANPAEAAKP